MGAGWARSGGENKGLGMREGGCGCECGDWFGTAIFVVGFVGVLSLESQEWRLERENVEESILIVFSSLMSSSS